MSRLPRALLVLGLPLLLAPCGHAQAPQSVRHLAEQGKLAEAEALARNGGDSLLVSLADLLVTRGALDSANVLYQSAVARRLPQFRSAQVGRAEIAMRRGDRVAALEGARTLVGEYGRRSGEWTADDRIAVGRAYLLLGGEDAQSVRQALALFDQATALTPDDPDGTLRAADLLLDKYNAPDAQAGYAAVLARDSSNARARFGVARVLAFAGNAGALEATRGALEVNAALVPARLLLARLHLEAEGYDSATAAVSRALAVDSTAMAAWATLGAIAWLRADSTGLQRAEARAQALSRAPADFYAELAEAAARHRRYADAVTFALRGAALDPGSPRVLGVLGVNQLRVGEVAAARASLERAFALDPFNLWHKNSLDLLDRSAEWRTLTSPRFELVLPGADADLLALYLVPLLESGYDSLVARYGYRPPTPIRLEVYDRHADFSVRTSGLPGIGALGVSFGRVLAMDAPSARPMGEFNFASTAWHELAHTFTLGMSDNRVPRWFSEGLSVLEERRAGHGWGMDVSLAFLETVAAGKLLPVSRINEGLVRPTYPAQIGDSYLQAALVCEMIEAEHGVTALRAMLRSFADGWDMTTVLQRTLKLTPAALDRRFDEWLGAKYAVPLAALAPKNGAPQNVNPIRTAVAEGVRLLEQGQGSQAMGWFAEAEKLFPGYPGPDGAAWPMARYYAEQKEYRNAAPLLTRITSRGETALEPNLLEAEVQAALGDAGRAASALERAVWIAPTSLAHHEALALAAEKAGRHGVVIRERRAVIALRPPNLLEARYQLARALQRSGDVAAARREVLSILEAAPTFEKAQELLLDLRGGG